MSWIDLLLVMAVIFVIAFWWQAGNRSSSERSQEVADVAISPTEIPLLQATPTATPLPPPTATPDVQPVIVSRDVTHTITSGETLLSIALDYDVTVEEIQQANQLTDVLIRVGEQLRIPIKETDSPAVAATGPTSTFRYTVQSGDTIVSIVARFGSTVEAVLSANNLTPNAIIRPGDELLVPISQVPQEVLESPSVSPEPAAPVNAASPSQVQPIYIQPQLIAPSDGATVARSEPVLLRWVSVDLLAPNEWYVLLIYPQSTSARTFPSIWTKTTSHRLETELAPVEGESALYAWQVSVVRVAGDGQNGYKLEAASLPSELRRFTWQ